MNEAVEIAGLRKYTRTELLHRDKTNFRNSGEGPMDPSDPLNDSKHKRAFPHLHHHYYLHAHIIINHANLPLVAGTLLQKAIPHT